MLIAYALFQPSERTINRVYFARFLLHREALDDIYYLTAISTIIVVIILNITI